MGGSSTGEKPLGEWNLRKPAQPPDIAQLSTAREHDVFADLVVRGIAQHQPRVIGLGSEALPRPTPIDRVEVTFGRVGRIVAAVLNEGCGYNPGAVRL